MFLFWRHHSFKPEYLFGHVARASPEDDRQRAVLAAIGNLRPDGKVQNDLVYTTWTRRVENDLAPLNIGLHSDLKKQDRTNWHRLVAMTTLWHEVCQ